MIVAASLAASYANAMTPPSITQATAVSGTEIDISWVAAIPDSGSTISEYRILRNGSIIATVNASTLTYSDTGLVAGTTYTYAVRALETVRSQSAAVAATTQSAPPPPPPPPIIQATATRPSYNTGTGFFVVGRGIYDANGNLFTPIGANRVHYDAYEPDRFLAKPNVERSGFIGPYGTDKATTDSVLQEDITNKVVPIPTEFGFNIPPNGTSGSADPAVLAAAVNNWVTNKAILLPYNNIALFNIANEWGPCEDDANPQVYRDSYITAVKNMRAAGYTGALVIDSGCSGESPFMLQMYADAIEQADPQHNIIFSIHIYNVWNYNVPPNPSNAFDFTTSMQLLAALDVPVIVGEFGCTNCLDTSPTPVTPDEIMQAAEQYQFGWLAWAWDDCSFLLLGPPSGCTSGELDYADRSAYGVDVINSPGFGMQAVAKPATVFP